MMTTRPSRTSSAGTSSARLSSAASYCALTLYSALVCAWLLIGLAVALTAHITGMHAWAVAAAAGQHGPGWTSIGKGLTAGAAVGYPVTAVVSDYVYSAAALLIAAALLKVARGTLAPRLVAVGILGIGAAFNLQAHTALDALAAAAGVHLAWVDSVLLHGIGVAACLVGLSLYPSGSLPWGSGRARTVATFVLAAAGGALGIAGADASHTAVFVLAFGGLLPLAAGAAQWTRSSRDTASVGRAQARLLLSALLIAFIAAVLLAATAFITQALQTPGLPRDVPGIGSGLPGLSGPLSGLGSQAVAFWIFRFVSLVIPCAVLLGVAGSRIAAVEQALVRALMYGTLVALIGAVYVLVVVRVDAWFGLDADWLAPPQVAAAGLVALVFHPVRSRFERWADRLVYGRRIAPEEALTQVAALSRTAAGPQALVSLAGIAAGSLRAASATAYLELEDGTRVAYRWPADPPHPEPTVEREIPVLYQGKRIGALGVPATASDRRAVLGPLTHAAALVMHNAGLSIELEHRLHAAEQRAAEIRASRWRIVAAQDGERRDLERDLHDGAQPGLTAVRLSLGLAAHLAKSDGPQAREALVRLRGQIDEASVNLRQTLRGLAPAALGEHGIGRALRDLAESLGTDNALGTDTALGTDAAIGIEDETDAARFASDTEAAVYFCCAEALQNAAKHCPGAAVTATLALDREAGVLRFTVTDDGPGFDAAVSTGSGMQNMADRIAAVGGELRIDSAAGAGTTVAGNVPATAPPGQSPESRDEQPVAAGARPAEIGALAP